MLSPRNNESVAVTPKILCDNTAQFLQLTGLSITHILFLSDRLSHIKLLLEKNSIRMKRIHTYII